MTIGSLSANSAPYSTEFTGQSHVALCSPQPARRLLVLSRHPG